MVHITDKTGLTLLATQDLFTVTLESSPSLNWNKQAVSSKGIATFTRLRFSAANTYQIQATSPYLATGLSQSLVIESVLVKSILIYPPDASPSLNFNFKYDFELIDEAGLLITDSKAVNLQTSPTIMGSTSVVTDTGSGTFTLTSQVLGEVTLNFTCDGLATEITKITVLPNTLKLSFSPAIVSCIQAVNISSLFDLNIFIYDNQGSSIESNFGVYEVYYSVSPSCLFACDEGSSANTSSGTFTFHNCYFTTSGKFNFTFTSDYMQDLVAGPYLVEDPLLDKISLTMLSKESKFIEFSVVVELFKASDVTYAGSSFSLTIETSPDLVGPSVFLCSDGLASLTFYSGSLGPKSIQVNASTLTSSKSIEIISNTLVFTAINPTVIIIQPSQVSDPFSVKVKVYNWDKSKVADSHGSFSITLSLNPASGLNGVLTKSSASGLASFDGISVATPDVYTLVASSDGIEDVQSWMIFIGVAQPDQIEVVFTPDSVSVYEPFVMKVLIKDTAGSAYLHASYVVVESNCGLFNGLGSSTVSGSVEFNLSPVLIESCDIQVNVTFSITDLSIVLTSSVSKEIKPDLLVFTALPVGVSII